MKIKDAMHMTGAKSNLSAFYQRVDCFRKRKAEEELADAASYEIKRGGGRIRLDDGGVSPRTRLDFARARGFFQGGCLPR